MPKPQKPQDAGGTSGSQQDLDLPAQGPRSAPRPGHGGLAARLRNYFFAGILVTAPIGITVYLVLTFVGIVDGWVTPLIPKQYNANSAMNPATYRNAPSADRLLIPATVTNG